MSDRIEPTVKDLADPVFLAWLKQVSPMPAEPDPQDLDPAARAANDEQRAHQWRLAQARKLARLWKKWQASRN